MQNIIKLLQLFADEGAATTGVTSGAADQSAGVTSGAADQNTAVSAENAGTAKVSYADRLAQLNVPKDKIRPKYNDKTVKAAETTPVAQVENSAEPELTWDKVKDLPFVKDEISKVVRASLERRNTANERMAKLAPALEVLARQYNMDGSDLEKLDYEALANAISADSHYYESKANEMGVDVETAKHIDELERDKLRRDRADARSIEERREREHFTTLVNQANELKTLFPNFDLRTEMQNPKFVRLTSPGSGLSVKDAYFALHREEIQQAQAQAIAQGVQQRMSNAYMSGMSRPVENGARGQAGSTGTISYRAMSKEQREVIKADMRRAAARGEKYVLKY